MEGESIPGKVRTARLILLTLGWLSIFTAAAELTILIYGSGILGLRGDEQSAVGNTILGGLGRAILVASLILAALFLLTAGGIRRRRKWARAGGIVLAVLLLPLFPMGTILGVFALLGLWGKDSRSWFGDRKFIPAPLSQSSTP